MALPKNSRQKSVPDRKKADQEHDLQSFRDIADDVIESDFVPYACLYDRETIATKDGELLQTIKITGLGVENTEHGDLRSAIRRAIKQAIPDGSYAIWLHTLRRQQSLAPRAHFPDSFSGQIDEAWRAHQPSSAFFGNELYITIVKAGDESRLRDINTFLQSLIPSRDAAARTTEIERLRRDLTDTTRTMLTLLAPYGARLLTVVAREGLYYSEQLEFLEKLINLEQRPIPVPERDLSHVLTSGEITFGYNAMEVRTEEGHRRFAAILTLKEYKESTLSGIDKFLEIPCEVIISQCFGFTDTEMAQDAYAKQARFLSISGDKELASWMEIDRLMQSGNTTGAQFGQQQTSLFLIATSVKQLEANVRLVQRALARLGMVVVREDLRFEECYWAQLPGNFPFVVRKHAVDTEHLAGFANLQSAPMGVAAGSSWGPPVSLLSTVQDTPYFFNFHRGASAHTIILGKPGSGRTSFTHFLLAQARKLPVAIWYLDAGGQAAPFIEAMGGKVAVPGTTGLKLNPLHLPQTPANRDFLALWLASLIDPHGSSLNQSTLAFFQSVIDQVFAMPQNQRRLTSVLPLLREADPALAVALQAFCAGGKHGELFDMPEDNFTTAPLIAWDISRAMGDPATRIPLASYLLHRLTTSLNGKPTLLVLDEGFEILNTPLFAPRISGWCDYLASQNAACLLTTAHVAMSGAHGFTSQIARKTATLFAFADPEPDAEYGLGFGLTSEDMATLAFIDAGRHHILQKRGNEAVVLNGDLSFLDPEKRGILSGHVKKDLRSPSEQLADLMGFGAKAV